MDSTMITAIAAGGRLMCRRVAASTRATWIAQPHTDRSRANRSQAPRSRVAVWRPTLRKPHGWQLTPQSIHWRELISCTSTFTANLRANSALGRRKGSAGGSQGLLLPHCRIICDAEHDRGSGPPRRRSGAIRSGQGLQYCCPRELSEFTNLAEKRWKRNFDNQ